MTEPPPIPIKQVTSSEAHHEYDFREGKLTPRPLSRLTFKILSLNIIILSVLAMSYSYLGQTRNNLLGNELKNLESETRLYAQLFMSQLRDIEIGKKKLLFTPLDSFEFPRDQVLVVFDSHNQKIASLGELPLRSSYIGKTNYRLDIFSRGAAFIQDAVSVNFNLKVFPGLDNSGHLLQDSTAEETINGLRIAAWSAPDGGLVLTSEKAVIGPEGELGRVLLIRRDFQIEAAFASTRLDIIRFFVVSLTLTLSISLYLSGLIGHPLRLLANAAESFRLNRGRGIDIPDLSHRHDEIGELSHAMREMADALRQRLVAIEQFAADVAHELKNPLTSLKSAAETLKLVKTDKDRDALVEIVLHDIGRMNRLITDISLASRLDAEVSREALVRVDLAEVIRTILAAHKATLPQRGGERFIMEGLAQPLWVQGQAGRLAQVFDNLIANALSFSPEGRPVTLTAEQNTDRIKITVDDEGTGIPEGSLKKIFERFYSERPQNEAFGLHSGLGLSIVRQIVEAHNGSVHAENRRNAAGEVVGARFVVRLRPWEI
ncbi:MAG: HAMP domain-containing sensor histidine kinase [Pseudobdellovibrionaceae bacterium]